jgi:hypothetical protein
MSDINDDQDELEILKSVAEETAPKAKVTRIKQPKRDNKGRIKKGSVSLNPNGRPKGTKAKLTMNVLENAMNKHGLEAIETVATIMKNAMAKDDTSTALKAGMWIGKEYIGFVLTRDKNLRMETKQAEKESDSEKDYEVEIYQQVSFG